LRLPDENNEHFQVVDIPLNFSSETPELSIPEKK
jgi:hypothetical protein